MSSSFKNIWQKVLIWLRVVVPPAGLEISDHEIRWCRFDGTTPRIVTVKIPPGVMEDGKVLNREALFAALNELRKAAIGANAKGLIGMVVTVALDAAPTFMRLFELPAVDKDRLESAVVLNLQMVSPGSATETAVGWQVLNEDKDRGRIEIGGLFIKRAIIDEIRDVVREAKFVVVAMESKAVSLARAIAKGSAGVDAAGKYVVIFADDSGLDFFIVRSGVLCFEYAVPWRDIADQQGTIPAEAFGGVVTRGFRQIMNFYRQHWSDFPTAVLVGAGDLFETVRSTIGNEITQPIAPFAIAGGSASAEAPVACGAALRPTSALLAGQEITFLGVDAAELYQQQKLLVFLRFWRTILPIVFAIIMVAILAVDMAWFKNGEAQAAAVVPTLSPSAISQLTQLASSTAQFNRSVALIGEIENNPSDAVGMITAFESAAASSSVTLSRVTLSPDGHSLTWSGSAMSENAIIAFKNALASTTVATDLSLPLSGIQPTGDGYDFTITGNTP